MTGTVGRGRYVFFSVAQAAATVGILSFLVWSFGLTPFVNAVMRLPPWTYPAGIGLGALGVVAQALRWSIVARHHAIRVPFGSAVARCWQASFLNSVLPGGLAGDALRAADDSSDARVDRGRRALASSFAAVAAERLIGTAVVFAAASIALAFVAPIFAAGCAVIAAFAAAIAGRWMRRLSRGETLAVVGLAIVGWAAFTAIFVVSAVALVPDPSAAVLTSTSAVAVAGMSVPLGVGGWGTREAAAAWAFEMLGSTAEDGLTVSIGYGILALASTLPGAVILGARVVPRVREIGRARARRRAHGTASERELGAEVGAEGEPTHGSAQRVGETVLPVEADAGHPVADQHRSGRQVEPAEGAVDDKA
ncbi:MAG: hypothetical protein DI630_29785 [Gordonia sp. (in: high G+C Gram-positive bacteria)]|nr:MAG: hypothetical protein DI630_29785 [Gordonia sp. (in: high G+C Gram-positive bacteria)]